MSTPLIDSALAVLREAQAQAPATFSTSFGVEDMVLLDLIRRHVGLLCSLGGGFARGGRGGPMGGNGAERYPQATATLEVDGAKWGDLHVRFKGNSSFNFAGNSLKHSLKLDFNDLDAKASLSGLDKLNLNNDAMDASGLRETLAYDVFHAAGVAAPRTALAKVYLTVPGQYERTYLGAYTAIEQVDKDFLKDRFGEKGGLLIKPEQNATLGYLGESWSTYESRMGEKVDATAAEGRRFVDFVRLLNQANDEEFARRIGDYVDVDQFLKFVAVQAALVNYDSPLMSGHNYYLYLNPKDHRFVWIPWDQNEAFGSFGVNGANAANMSILEPSAPNSFRMADRVLAMPGARAKYEAVVRDLLAGPFKPERLDARVADLAPVVRGTVAADPLINAFIDEQTKLDQYLFDEVASPAPRFAKTALSADSQRQSQPRQGGDVPLPA